MGDDCLFCKIAQKQIPADIVYKDREIMAFRDIKPQAPTHVLIIPHKHIERVLDVESGADSQLVGKMVQAANRIAVKEGIADKGFRLVLNCNADAGQEVFHIHLHLLGGRKMGWPPG